DQTSDLETFLLFMEEVGELAKAIRRHRDLYTETGTPPPAPEALAEEFADVLSYLMELANRHQVDLTDAYRDKEAQNAARDWG
ncbi:MAG: RS21-C6 protein, partial [Bacteroidetes bacterium]